MNRVKDLRLDRDLTQKEVADAIGISQRKYSYFETGDHQLTASFVIALAKYYNTSTDYILGLTNCRRPYPPVIGRRIKADLANCFWTMTENLKFVNLFLCP